MPFVPTDIAGLVLWLKADAGTYTDTGLTTPAVNENDLVAGWQDQSGTGNHMTQATSGQRPLLKLGVQKDLPALLFDGSNDRLTNAMTQAQPDTVFVVARNITGTDDHHIFDGTNRQVVGFTGGNAVIYAGTFLADGATVTTWRQISAVFNGASSLISIQGSALSGDAGVISVASPAIGGRSDAEAFNGYIGEVLIYNSALSTANRQQVEQYLIDRWFGGHSFEVFNKLRPRPFAPGLAR